MAGDGEDQLRHGDERKARYLILPCIIAAAAALRYVFVDGIETLPFDPWRHLQLVKNISDGAGFTLFGGQPYIWYSPHWYYLASMLAPLASIEWVSCFLSVLSAIVFTLFLLRTEKSPGHAVTGGFMMAAFGPAIAFSCTYGSESFALFLMLSALLLAAYRSDLPSVLICGLLFGTALVSRMNFAFNFFLFMPVLKSRKTIIVFIMGIAVVFLLAWMRNNAIINGNAFVFTWDGLATKSNDYNFLSTLVPQMHPAISEGNRMLYEKIMPFPNWLHSRGQIQWGPAFFMLSSVVCLALSGRPWLIAAGIVPMIYFNFFERTLSASFFRHYVALFPVFFMGISIFAEKIGQKNKGFIHYIRILAVVSVLVSGVGYLKPSTMFPVERAVPPAEMTTGEYYMVNSGFFHPESLVFYYPDKRFIGMPLYPEQFDELAQRYPRYAGSIIWQLSFSVQNDLLKYLTESGRYRVDKMMKNRYGVGYLLLTATVPRDNDRL